GPGTCREHRSRSDTALRHRRPAWPGARRRSRRSGSPTTIRAGRAPGACNARWSGRAPARPDRVPSSRAPAHSRRRTRRGRRAARNDGARYAPALETLSIDLAMARDPVDADVAHAHTWYADMAGLWIRTLHRIPLIVTLHSMEPLRPWKADQLGSGYLLSSWIE